MNREIHVKVSFGDLLYILTLLRCVQTHRSWRCLRQGLRELRASKHAGWEPFTVGDWIELRRWRAWAAREHERQSEPTPWRHERPSAQLPRDLPPLRLAGAGVDHYRRHMIWPGLSLVAVGGGSMAGVLLHEGHTLPGAALIVCGSVLFTAVLRYVGKVD